MRSFLSPSLAALALLSTSSIAVAAPLTFSHQGRLFDVAGDPLTGAHTIAFSLHDAPAGGATLWSEPHTVQFDNGYYAVVLGSSSPLDPADFASDDVYLGLAVDGAPPLARTQLHSVPWALRADTATNVDGGIVNASEIRINGNTVIDSTGSANVAWSDLSGVPTGFADGTDDGLKPPTCVRDEELIYNGSSWICEPKNLHDHSAADITSGTLDMNRIPVGTSTDTVARGSHTHGFADLTGQVAANQLPATMADLTRQWVTDGSLGSLTVGGNQVIDANGAWVGAPTGLVGPAGPQGVAGAAGPKGADGAAGPAGADGATGPRGRQARRAACSSTSSSTSSAAPPSPTPLVAPTTPTRPLAASQRAPWATPARASTSRAAWCASTPATPSWTARTSPPRPGFAQPSP